MNQLNRQTPSLVCSILLCFSLWGCAGSSMNTEVPVASVSEQWRSLSIDNFSVDIPPCFIAGLPGLELEALQGSLEEMGFGDRADWLAQNAENIDIVAFQQVDGDLNSINVVRAGRSPDETVTDYLEQQVTQLEAAGIDVESQAVAADPTIGSLQLRQADQAQSIYVFASTDDFWVVTYSGEDGQFDEMLIEQSRRSVEIPRES